MRRLRLFLLPLVAVLCIPLLNGAMCTQASNSADGSTTPAQQPAGPSKTDVLQKEMAYRYQPAEEDLSAEAQLKAKAAGGVIFLSPDSLDQVVAYYDTTLRDMDEGIERTEEQGVVRYRFQNLTGEMVDISVTQAGPKKEDGTHILVVVK